MRRTVARGSAKGKWNLTLQDEVDGTPIAPELTLLDTSDELVQVAFDDFGLGSTLTRGVPARRLTLADGTTTLVATVYDLLMAQYGVPRGLPDADPRSDDDVAPYTPAWAEHIPASAGPTSSGSHTSGAKRRSARMDAV